MRIRVVSKQNQTQRTFPSFKSALQVLGVKNKKDLEKEYYILRYYPEGYWRDVDAGWLKEIGRRHKDVGYCLIE